LKDAHKKSCTILKITNNHTTNSLTESQNQIQGVNESTSILVFATTINNKDKAAAVRNKLLENQGIQTVDIDLEDWENVLRVVCESQNLVNVIEQTLSAMGMECKELT